MAEALALQFEAPLHEPSLDRLDGYLVTVKHIGQSTDYLGGELESALATIHLNPALLSNETREKAIELWQDQTCNYIDGTELSADVARANGLEALQSTDNQKDIAVEALVTQVQALTVELSSTPIPAAAETYEPAAEQPQTQVKQVDTDLNETLDRCIVATANIKQAMVYLGKALDSELALAVSEPTTMTEAKRQKFEQLFTQLRHELVRNALLALELGEDISIATGIEALKFPGGEEGAAIQTLFASQARLIQEPPIPIPLRTETFALIAEPADEVEPSTEEVKVSDAPNRVAKRSFNKVKFTEFGHKGAGQEAQRGRFAARDEAVQTIVKKYRQHPGIEHKLQPYRDLKALSRLASMPVQNAKSQFELEAQTYKLLTAEDEYRLASRLEAGMALYKKLGGNLDDLSPEQEALLIDTTAAYETIVNCNLRLVGMIANNRYKQFKDSLPKSDLIQEGIKGLLKAAGRFDITKGNKFSTFTYGWIDHYVRRAIADTGRTIRLPVHEHEKWLKMLDAACKLEAELQRKPTIAEIAKANGMTIQELEELRLRGRTALPSLNERFDDGKGNIRERGEFIADSGGIDTELLSAIHAREWLPRLIAQSSLDPKSLVILSLRYGLYLDILKDVSLRTAKGKQSYDNVMEKVPKGEKFSLDQVGIIFGVTRERIRQIEAQALKDLQAVGEFLTEADDPEALGSDQPEDESIISELNS